jgi:hypothetical protein
LAKNNTKRPDKILPNGRPGGGAIAGTYQSPPVAERVYGPDYERYKTKQGYWAYRKKTGKKAKPLDKSKKKGSPRSYENLKKAKPVGKGKKGKGPS